MSTKKNVQENALLEVSDEELAQYSGGGIMGSLPVVGPVLDPVVQTVLPGTEISAGVGVKNPLLSTGAGLDANPGVLSTIL